MPTNVFKTQKARHRGKPAYGYAEGRSTQGDVVFETVPSTLFVRGDVVMDRRSDQMRKDDDDDDDDEMCDFIPLIKKKP